MFKKQYILLYFLISYICVGAQIVTIGDSNSISLNVPFSLNNNYSYSQQIYLQNEINQSGLICGMSLFKCETINFSRTVKIYLGETNRTIFQHSTDWIYADSIREVFSGNINFDQEGWCYINFDIPFDYKNLGNLVITWDDNSQIQDYTMANRFATTNVNYKSLIYHGDSINPIYYNPPMGYVVNRRNIIKLHFCDPVVMTQGNYGNCNFLFSDPGGMNNYSDSLNIIQTLYSANTLTNEINVHFLNFEVEHGDTLFIYDGNSTFSPIVGIYTNQNIPHFYQSNSDTLTFHFKTDSVNNASGWLVYFQCNSCTPASNVTGSPCESNNYTVTGYAAIPFCTEDNPLGVTYSSGTTGFATNYFGQTSFACFDIAPAPKWHYMQIDHPGNMLIHISQTSPQGGLLDADFACWGPFYAENQFDFMHKLCCGHYPLRISPNISHCPLNGDHSDLGSYPDNTLVDCSYSPISTEWCYIPNAQKGQFYLLLITNFSGIPGTLHFNTVPEYTTATTKCDLLTKAQNNGPLCIGDTLRLFYLNPKPGETYLWSGPNGFTSNEMSPVIPDCNSNHAGLYSIVVSTIGLNTQTYYTYVVIGTPPTLTLESSSTTICQGDSVILKAYGALHYDWSHFYEDIDTIVAFPSESTTYSVIGRFGGCSDSSSIDIEVIPQITYTISKKDLLCFGFNDGEITMNIGGGIPPYQLLWSTNDTSTTITSLSSGGYSALITDQFGCMLFTPYIEINSPPSINVESVTTGEHCDHLLGSINLSVSGGVLPYTYEWSYLNSNTPTLLQLSEGVYSCTITDGNGCLKIFSETILDSSLVVKIDTLSPAKCGKFNGWINLQVENVFGTVNYNWSNISDYIENHAFNIAPGIYGVVVSDDYCSDTLLFEIEELPYPIACFEIMASNNFEINSSIHFLNCSENENDWVWDFGDFSKSYIENPSHVYQYGGTYTIWLVVSNEIGCQDSISKTIEIKEIELFIPSSFTPNGDGLNDQFIPIMNNVSSEGYLMSIYNRWGELIFKTENIDQGWDGTHQGVLVPSQSYSYILIYENSFGKKFRKTGTIHLIR